MSLLVSLPRARSCGACLLLAVGRVLLAICAPLRLDSARIKIGVGIKVVETARVAVEMAAAEEEVEAEGEAEEEAAAVGARTTTRMVARTREQLQPKSIKAQKRLFTFSDF